MNFNLDEEQTLLRDSVCRFVAQQYGFEERRAVLAQGGFSRTHWTSFAQMGWLGAGLPEAAGGYGGTAVETALIAEALGRGLVVEPFVEVAVLAARALLSVQPSGGPAAAALGALIDGGCLILPALHEAACGLTSASNGRLRLSGRQTMVIGAAQADRFLVAADTAEGVSLLLLDAAAPRVQRHDYRLIDGSPASDLLFDGVDVDAAQRLGAAGSAAPAIAAAREHAIVAYCAQALGVMDLALTKTRDYLLERRQFGVAIASFQALRHRLADMLIAHEQARATLHGALAALSSSNPIERRRAVAIAKAQSGRSGRFIGAQAIQLHGGIGMTDEYVIGHCFKRLMVLDQLLGSRSTHLAALVAMREADA
jgi:alkylation response protein AidB-like acyl-CoA dehydrogenase